MTWVVGRGDGGCYIEEGEPVTLGGVPLGEQPFDTEREAIEFAIMCEEDLLRPVKRNLKSLRNRLRRLDSKLA